jgi:DNA polymerase I-like protein with 3'-5' exonuclease and polymerase domains
VCNGALRALRDAAAAAEGLALPDGGGAAPGAARAVVRLRAAARVAGNAQAWREAAGLRRAAAALREALARAPPAPSAPRGAGGARAPPRVHASVATATATGRWCFSDPPLQGLPRGTPPGVTPLRAALVAPPGALLLAADYRAAELRVLAHFSSDGALLGALGGGGDVFEALARELLALPPGAAVGASERGAAKALAYGILYGMGDCALGAALGLLPHAAAARRAAFHACFPGMRAYIATLAAAGAAAGEVRTLAGRRRAVAAPQLRREGAAAAADPGRAARQAVNFVMQGSVADLAAVAAASAVVALPAGAARLVLVVHDELVFEVAVAGLGEAAGVVRDAMLAAGEALGMRAPLAVRLTAGPNYGALEELRL